MVNGCDLKDVRAFIRSRRGSRERGGGGVRPVFIHGVIRDIACTRAPRKRKRGGEHKAGGRRDRVVANGGRKRSAWRDGIHKNARRRYR